MFTFDNHQIVAGIYRDNAYKGRVEGNRIDVETSSTYDLLRGDQQQTFGLNGLKADQQRGILESLSSRNIEIRMLTPSLQGPVYALTIGALR